MNCIRIAIAALALAAPLELTAAQIYLDNFDGAAAADLNGTTPDVGANNWAAHTAFDANGLVTPVTGGSSAVLPFTPAAGNVYTLTTSLRGVTGNTNWFGAGFVESVPANPQASGNDNRFISGATVGKAWMLFRGATSPTAPLQSLRGDAASGTPPAGVAVTWLGGFTPGGDIDLQIILDAAGGPGTWKAQFFAKRPADASYTDVGGGALALLAEDIGGVGLAYSNTGISGSVVHFSLEVTPVPEPASVGMIGLGFAAVGLFVQRRRQR
jgi:hypothetical protein